MSGKRKSDFNAFPNIRRPIDIGLIIKATSPVWGDLPLRTSHIKIIGIRYTVSIGLTIQGCLTRTVIGFIP